MTLSDTDLELVDEYVLGLLAEDEERAFETRLSADADLVAAVERARERFLPLDDTAAHIIPPPGLWRGIEAAIEAGERSTGPRVAPARPASRPRRAPNWPAADRQRPADALALRFAALGGLAASLVMAAVLAWSLLLKPGPSVYAGLINDQGELVALIESSPENRVRVVLLDDVPLGEDRVIEVWTQPDPDGPPISLGTIEALASKTLSLAGYPPPADDQFYAISLERPGGSPTGLPTGPIVGQGFAREPL